MDKNIENIIFTWDADGSSWYDKYGEHVIINQENDNYNKKNLDFNILIVKKKIEFRTLLNEFIAILGVNVATPKDSIERNLLLVILVGLIIPFKIKVFKENDTKLIFDLLKNDYGDLFIYKNELKKLNNISKQKKESIIFKLIKEGFISDEGEKYYLRVNQIKNFNIL